MKPTKQSLTEITQAFARETSILQTFVTVMRSFSDYLYCCAVVGDSFALYLDRVSEFKSIPGSEVTILSGAAGSILNALSTWVDENAFTGGLQATQGLSSSLLSRIETVQRKKLIEVCEKAESLEPKTKIELARLVHDALESYFFGTLLAFDSLGVEAKDNLVILYSSDCAFRYPLLLMTIDSRAQEHIASKSGKLASLNYNVDDPEIRLGYKKPVVIDIGRAMLETYLMFASSTIKGLTSGDRAALQSSNEALRKMVRFFADQSQVPLASDHLADFESPLNFYSLLQAIKVTRTQAQGGMCTMSLGGDVESRKFFILLPGEYGLFSSVSNLVRSQEFANQPWRFVLQYEGERLNSLRLNSARHLINELDELSRQSTIEGTLQKWATKAGVEANSVGEATVVGALSYLVWQAIGATDSATKGVVAGLIEYMKIRFVRKISARQKKVGGKTEAGVSRAE